MKSIWGDGFVDDDVFDIFQVGSWDLISDDEFVFYFPRLVERRGANSSRLVKYLGESLATRAFRLKGKGFDVGPLKSMSVQEMEYVGGDKLLSWFEDHRPFIDRLAGMGRVRVMNAEFVDELAGIRLLDEVLLCLQSGRLYEFEDQEAGRFAFFSSINPAYCSASLLGWSCRDLVAGWLGIIHRGRSALMPCCVAEYLIDVIRYGMRGELIVSDLTIRQMVQTPSNWKMLKRYAEDRLSGRNRDVRLRHALGLPVANVEPEFEKRPTRPH